MHHPCTLYEQLICTKSSYKHNAFISLNTGLHVTLGQVVVGVVKSLSADSMIETTPLSTNFWELTGEPQDNT